MSYRRLPRETPPLSASERAGAAARPVDLGRVPAKSAELMWNGPYPDVAHLLDAAGCVLALDDLGSPVLPRTALRGMGADGVRCLALLAALHDLGKATTGFAARFPDSWRAMWPGPAPPAAGAATGHTRPGQASAVLDEWPVRLSEGPQPLEGAEIKELRQFLGLVIGAHHGRITSVMSETDAHVALKESRDGGADWPGVRCAIAELVWRALGCPHLRLGPQEDVLAAVAACGLVPFADWIVSQTPFIEQQRRSFLPSAWTPESAAAFLDSSVAAAKTELIRLGLTPLRLRDAAFTKRYTYPPRGLQLSVCSELESHVTGPGLLIVTDRTGGGKTETAQEALQIFRRRTGSDLGLMFCLPTMATTSAMFRRTVKDLAPLLGRGATVELLHSMAAFSEEADRVLRELYGDPAETSPIDAQVDATALGQVASEERSEECGARFDLSAQGTHKLLRLPAPLTVATVDQLLAAALPGRHQPFRLTGLLGKVVVIDECHAYDVYMRVLLRTVLSWLGAFGVPVVLLSATLPAKTAREYLDAYRQGAEPGPRGDHSSRGSGGEALPYPGWSYYDRGSGAVTVRESLPDESSRLTVTTHTYTLPAEQRSDLVRRGERLAQACRGILEPILEPEGTGQGCALVIVNTVTAAQALAASLRAQAPPDCAVHLLHARMRTKERERRTGWLESLFGKRSAEDPTGRPQRPRRCIVVATQVAEQSLDWDFDVILSELAPVSLLLQRAGRAHRHRTSSRVPPPWNRWTLHVLADIDEDRGQPAEAVPYPYAALLSTWAALRTGGAGEDSGRARTVDVPHGVQGLVEDAEPDLSLLGAADGVFEEALMSWWADESVQASRGDQAAVPTPGRDFSRGDLHRLTDADADVEGILTTRLGAETLRLLPVWYRDGAPHLEPDRNSPLPQAPPVGKAPSHAAVRTVMEHSLPARSAAWQEEAAADPPEWFADHPVLGSVLVVPFRDAVEPSVIPGAGDSAGYRPVRPPRRYTVAFSPDYGLFAAPRPTTPR